MPLAFSQALCLAEVPCSLLEIVLVCSLVPTHKPVTTHVRGKLL